MLGLTRGYVAYLLAGYGEPEVSAAILKTSDENFRQVQAAGNRGSSLQRVAIAGGALAWYLAWCSLERLYREARIVVTFRQ